MDLVTIALAVGATIAWALTWVLMKVGVDEMSWLGFGLLRPWIGLPLIGLYAWGTHGLFFGSADLVLVGLTGGVVNAFLGTALYYYALSHGSMHESNILANTGPFWSVVSAIVVLGEAARPVVLVAGVLVLGGTYFLVRRSRRDDRSRNLRALLAALGTGVLWGVSTAVPTKLCMDRGMDPAAYQLLFVVGAAFAWSIAVLPSLWRRRLRFTLRGVWIAFASSILGLVVGWVLWLTALQRADASALSPLTSLSLLFVVVFGVVFLREPINRRIVVGGTLTVAGVTLVSVLVR